MKRKKGASNWNWREMDYGLGSRKQKAYSSSYALNFKKWRSSNRLMLSLWTVSFAIWRLRWLRSKSIVEKWN
jgi:hypothetical protein